MKIKKNNIAIFLMLSSIILLVIFQFFWLKKVYKDEEATFLKEAHFAFIHTVSDLQDSLMTEILHSEGDSTLVRIKRFNSFQNRALGKVEVATRENEAFWRDTVTSERFNIRKAKSSSIRDSTQTIDFRFSNGQPQKQETHGSMQFVVEMSSDDTLRDFKMALLGVSDSLDITSIENALMLEFNELNHIAFNVERFPIEQHLPHRNGWFAGTTIADFPPMHQYALYFPQLRMTLVKRMIPDTLFSLALLLITGLAFLFIYRSLRKQQKLTLIKNDLIRNITHELKTPIATVSVAIEALDSFDVLDDPMRTEEYLHISKNELNRLSMLVDKVLKTSIFDSSEHELKIEVLDLKSLLDRILQSFKIQFDKYSADVKLHVSGDNFEINGDRVHLTSVIYNLIDNAIKYSIAAPEIAINLENRKSHIDISVRDNGIGIPKEYQARIFDQFFRVPTGDVHDIKGHGLGLSYVASIIRMHGGNINVESSPGQGSQFNIQIPRS